MLTELDIQLTTCFSEQVTWFLYADSTSLQHLGPITPAGVHTPPAPPEALHPDSQATVGAEVDAGVAVAAEVGVAVAAEVGVAVGGVVGVPFTGVDVALALLHSSSTVSLTVSVFALPFVA